VSSCLNQFGKEWSITSFYCASNKSSLCRLEYRTCWKPTVVSQLQRGSEVHKPSIFSNICSSGLIRHDWSLNHLQEEPFHRMELCFFLFFRLLVSANKLHWWRKTLSFTSRRAAYMDLGKKGCISVQSPSLAKRLISGYSRWDAYWALKSLHFRNTNLGTSQTLLLSVWLPGHFSSAVSFEVCNSWIFNMLLF